MPWESALCSPCEVALCPREPWGPSALLGLVTAGSCPVRIMDTVSQGSRSPAPAPVGLVAARCKELLREAAQQASRPLNTGVRRSATRNRLLQVPGPEWEADTAPPRAPYASCSQTSRPTPWSCVQNVLPVTPRRQPLADARDHRLPSCRHILLAGAAASVWICRSCLPCLPFRKFNARCERRTWGGRGSSVSPRPQAHGPYSF